MTAEIIMTSNDKEITRGAAGLETIQRTMDQFLSAAKVEAVYGQPLQQGDMVIIPSAEVISVMGFGLGSGVNTDQDQVGKKENNEGMGGGGGGRVFSRPVAVIVASPEGVRIEPVVDLTKVILAALTTFGFMAGMIAQMYKPTKSNFN
jgi:uncharacterized spore protein YtfJ